MRRPGIFLLAALAIAVAALAQERLDLLVGHGLETLPAPDRDGFRVALGGAAVLRVAPEGDDRARLFETGAASRVVNLPPVAPLTFAVPSVSPPSPSPHFISTDFSTFYDGLALLLADPPPAIALRWSATLRLTTDPGHVGNSRVAIVARADRLPNRELDEQIARFLAANPLPPLAGGAGLCDVEAAATPGQRPLLNVWVGEPYAEDAAWTAPSSRGWVMQEPIGWPPAVLDAKTAAPARDAFAKDWRAAKTDLLARLAAANGAALYGNWRFTTPNALAAARQALAAAPTGHAEPSLYLGAWALARDRRFAEAQQWMSQIATASRDPALAGEARWLTLAWSRRIGGDARFRPGAPWPGRTQFAWQNVLAMSEPAEQTDRAAALDELGALQKDLPREDADFLLRATTAHAANALAKTVENASPSDAAAIFEQWSKADPLAADWDLFDAGAALLAAGKPRAAIEAFRSLLGKYPLSPLAPQAAWATIAAGTAAGDREFAMAAAWRVIDDTTPGSAWIVARAESGDSSHFTSTSPGEDRKVVTVPIFPPRTPTIGQLRARTLRWLRDAEFADFLKNKTAEALPAAERAARMLLDEAVAPELPRLDWLALGDILHAAGRRPDAARAYANVALDKRDDALRAAALKALAASLTPDARRVALALAGDKKLGPLLAPLRP